LVFLELVDVAKGFGPLGRRTEVLGSVNLAIHRGEFVAIVGRSGSGKTTLLSTLAGLLAPDSGRVLLEGREVCEPGPDRAVVFQNYSLLPWLTVHQNVALGVDQVFPDWPVARRREQ